MVAELVTYECVLQRLVLDCSALNTRVGEDVVRNTACLQQSAKRMQGVVAKELSEFQVGNPLSQLSVAKGAAALCLLFLAKRLPLLAAFMQLTPNMRL